MLDPSLRHFGVFEHILEDWRQNLKIALHGGGQGFGSVDHELIDSGETRAMMKVPCLAVPYLWLMHQLLRRELSWSRKRSLPRDFSTSDGLLGST